MSVDDEVLLQEIHDVVAEANTLGPMLVQIGKDTPICQLGRLAVVMATLLNRLTIRVIENTDEIRDLKAKEKGQ